MVRPAGLKACIYPFAVVPASPSPRTSRSSQQGTRALPEPHQQASRSASSQNKVRALGTLPEAASLLLDILRFSLCLLVLLGHATQHTFNTGWPNWMVLANTAVPAFFVLSGFVIRYVTQTRERDGRRYFASRASRIYSVLLPAIALTLVLDAVSFHHDPAFYRSVLLPAPPSQLPARILLNLLFLSQSWGHTTLLLSDTPLWSLGYEVPYYLIFGAAAFLRGPARIGSLLLIAALIGPQVLFLLPLWYSGVWLYDLWQWFRSGRSRPTLRVATLLGSVLMLVFLLFPVGGQNGFDRIAALPHPLLFLHQPVERATMWEYSAGLFSFAALFLFLCATDLVTLPSETPAARAVRFVAESTFTLYVFHFPMLLFAGAFHLYRPDHTMDKLLLLAAIVLLCIAASVPIERFKRLLRRSLLPNRIPA